MAIRSKNVVIFHVLALKSGVAYLSKNDKVFSEKEEMKKKSGKRLAFLTNSINVHVR